ncbi:MAG: carboxypeptidase-like regulatory domain-containing protein [Pyrinomonadaceae bacterium]
MKIKTAQFLRKLSAGTLAFIVMFGVLAASLPAQAQKDDDTSGRTLETHIDWKSYFCKAVNESSNSNLQHVTTDYDLKLNYTPSTTPTTFPFASNANPERQLVGPVDNGNSITTTRVGNKLNWTSTKAISAVIIGASSGNSGRVYWYTNGSFGSNNLQNPSLGTITSVNFCYYQPAKVTIIKEAFPFGGSGASTQSFAFSSTNLPSPSNFALVDNNAQPADRRIVTDLYKFAKLGSGNWITVTESLLVGWSLGDIECTDKETVDNQTQYPNVIDLTNRKVTIKLEEGEHVTCTFRNAQLQPSAATASITGRIRSASGRGIGGVSVSLTNPITGAAWYTSTTSFGYYRFDGLEVAEVFVIFAAHKRYTFNPNLITVQLNDDVAGQDFIANP